MPWYPLAERKQLTVPNRAKHKVAMPTPKRANLHTAVSNGRSLYNFFNSSGARGVFSHFFLREDGSVEQYQSTDYRAACDLDGNPDTISIETWDGYPNGWSNSSDVPTWNQAQVAGLVALVQWIWRTHPSIPRKLATSNRRGAASHGLSWHRLGVVGAPGYIAPTNGGLRYSTSRGKICPGPRRINQVPAIYTAAVFGSASAGNPTITTPQEDDIMAAITKEELAAIVQEQTRAAVLSLLETEKRYGEYADEDGKGRDFRTLADYWLATHANAVAANRTLAALAAKEGLDEKTVVAGVVAGLKPVIEGVLIDTGANVDVDRFIDALAKRLEA